MKGPLDLYLLNKSVAWLQNAGRNGNCRRRKIL